MKRRHTTNLIGERMLTIALTMVITIALSLSFIGIHGCAPLPPLDDHQNVTTTPDPDEPQISQAERDSIIGVRLSFGHERWKNKDFEMACVHFAVVAHYDVTHSKNIYGKWANAYVERGILDSAQHIYEQGIKYFPDDEYLRTSLATMYTNASRFTDAIAQLKEAVRIKPDNETYLRDLERLYERVEDWNNAIDTYRKLADLLPDDQQVKQNLIALIRLHLDPTAYLQELKDAVEKFPDDPKRRMELIRVLLEQGEQDEALTQLDTYLKAVPNDVDGWRRLARIQSDKGNVDGSIAALQKVVDIDPDATADMVLIGMEYLGKKQYVNARIWAQKAIAKNNQLGSAWLLMGDIYYRGADDASGSTPKYDDKLVFAVALGLFQKALNTGDSQVRSDAERMIRSVNNLVPTKEERFMRKGKDRPATDGYPWLNLGWPEVAFLDSFLSGLDK